MNGWYLLPYTCGLLYWWQFFSSLLCSRLFGVVKQRLESILGVSCSITVNGHLSQTGSILFFLIRTNFKHFPMFLGIWEIYEQKCFALNYLQGKNVKYIKDDHHVKQWMFNDNPIYKIFMSSFCTQWVYKNTYFMLDRNIQYWPLLFICKYTHITMYTASTVA